MSRMIRTMLPLALLGLLIAVAPLATAQDESPAKDEAPAEPERPDDAAWVEDCPPDMMCAAGSEDHEEPTSDPDCGGEVCAYEERPDGALGPEDCIECMQPPKDDAGTCMDGQQEGEVCDDDVYYMDGPSRGPEDGSCENCRGDDASGGEEPLASHDPAEGEVERASDKTSKVPGPAAAAAIVGMAVALGLLLAIRTRK